jgi:AP-1 complex subunit mu
VKPLIWVECVVDKHSRSRTEYLVKARSQFKERSAATNVEISLPLPPDAISPSVRTSQVRALADARCAVLPWRLTLCFCRHGNE